MDFDIEKKFILILVIVFGNCNQIITQNNKKYKYKCKRLAQKQLLFFVYACCIINTITKNIKIMPSYSVIKTNKETKEINFLMANAVGTKTFGTNISNAWISKDHRIACDIMNKCIEKHKDKDKFDYIIDDLDESGDW